MQTQQRSAFRHQTIDPAPPGDRLGVCLVTDLTGNGRDDVIVGGLGRVWAEQSRTSPFGFRLPNVEGTMSLVGRKQPNLYWYENLEDGWERHAIGSPPLDVGAALGDIDGDGLVDIVVGQGRGHHDVYWFEQPSDPRERWPQHKITDRFEKYHDLAVGDVDDDGENEVVGLSQESRVLFYYDVPANPYQSPWPDSRLHVVARDFRAEGLAIADVDGDGRTEIVAGTSIFSRDPSRNGQWTREDIVTGWDDTRVAVGDVDGDGELEIVLTEGDSPRYGTHPGRVAWFDAPDWTPTVLADDLFCPHTLLLEDFTGNGSLDIYVAEMGLGQNEDPKHVLFANEGGAAFTQNVVARGVATHEAKVADLTGTGRPDVVGKSYKVGTKKPDFLGRTYATGQSNHVDAWLNPFRD